MRTINENNIERPPRTFLSKEEGPISIEAIKFNHHPASADRDALNIRKNASQFIYVPEWVRGYSLIADDSLAAYAINEIEAKGNTITIQAKFRCSDPSIQSIEICAREPGNGGAQGCIYSILRQLGIVPIIPPPFGNLLGVVKPRVITIPASGETSFETFELELWWPLSTFGVGIHTVNWRWQYRINSTDSWTDFATTSHKIYTVLEVPKSPWLQIPYNASNYQLPWTEVLDYSCTWAGGSSNEDTAAGKITKRINALGPSIIRYDKTYGANYYNVHKEDDYPGLFACTQFLDRIRGGYGLGGKVNCSDCAAIVSTFANILGCNLWQSKMYEGTSLWTTRGFELNKVIAIGYTNWEKPFNGSFRYHEVAWKGTCNSNESIFDACLKVDGDSDPTSPPRTLLLPVNIEFDECGTPYKYRGRLASTKGCPKCTAQPSSRTRREVI